MNSEFSFLEWRSVLLSNSTDRLRSVERWLTIHPNLNAIFPESGHTLLSSATYLQCFDVIRRLIELGADPDAVDDAGWSALHWCCQAQKSRSLFTLLECGANPNVRDPLLRETATPLHFCAMSRAFDCAKILIDFGADPTCIDPATSGSALHWSAYDLDYMKKSSLFQGIIDPDPLDRSVLYWAIKHSSSDENALQACQHWIDLGCSVKESHPYEPSWNIALHRGFYNTFTYLTCLDEAEHLSSDLHSSGLFHASPSRI